MFDVLIRACIHDHASISDLGHKTGIVACLDYILLLLFKAHDIFLNREEIMYIPIQKKEGGGLSTSKHCSFSSSDISKHNFQRSVKLATSSQLLVAGYLF